MQNAGVRQFLIATDPTVMAAWDIRISSNPPTGPTEGARFLESDTGKKKIFLNGKWVTF